MINYENLPYRESMKKRLVIDPSYRNYHYDRESYIWISRMIEHSVGKKFDDIYHKVCKKFTKKKDWECKRYFLDLFEWSYKVDEDGIIRRKNVYTKPRRSILIPKTNYPIIYRIRSDFWGISLPSYISKFLTYQENIKLRMRSTDPKLGEKVKYLIEDYYGRTLSNNDLGRYLSIEDPNEYERYYEGSPEYAKYTHEQDSKRRKKAREYAKQLKEYKSNLLNYVEAERKRNDLGEDSQLCEEEF